MSNCKNISFIFKISHEQCASSYFMQRHDLYVGRVLLSQLRKIVYIGSENVSNKSRPTYRVIAVQLFGNSPMHLVIAVQLFGNSPMHLVIAVQLFGNSPMHLVIAVQLFGNSPMHLVIAVQLFGKLGTVQCIL